MEQSLDGCNGNNISLSPPEKIISPSLVVGSQQHNEVTKIFSDISRDEIELSCVQDQHQKRIISQHYAASSIKPKQPVESTGGISELICSSEKHSRLNCLLQQNSFYSQIDHFPPIKEDVCDENEVDTFEDLNENVARSKVRFSLEPIEHNDSDGIASNLNYPFCSSSNKNNQIPSIPSNNYLFPITGKAQIVESKQQFSQNKQTQSAGYQNCGEEKKSKYLSPLKISAKLLLHKAFLSKSSTLEDLKRLQSSLTQLETYSDSLINNYQQHSLTADHLNLSSCHFFTTYNMKPLFLPFFVFIVSTLVVTSQLQHSSFDGGHSGTFTSRDGPKEDFVSAATTLPQHHISVPATDPPIESHESTTTTSADLTTSVFTQSSLRANPNIADSCSSMSPQNGDSLSDACTSSSGAVLTEWESFAAFQWLHNQIDDDKDGELNARETGDFLAQELGAGSGAHQRHASFHSKHDSHISLQELWDNWKVSGIHNWTVNDVEEWLTNYVELPQYLGAFRKLEIDGKSLPRLCVSSNNSLFQRLGILSKTHQRKMALKATDVVLFGIPKKNTLLKDMILLAGLLISLLSCWYLFWQYNYSQKQLKKVMKDLGSLQVAEDSLRDTQQELAKHKKEKEEIEQNSKNVEQRVSEAYNDGKLDIIRSMEQEQGSSVETLALKLAIKEEENNELKLEIEKLENMVRQQSLERLSAAVSDTNASSELPPLLVEWLQITYEVETKHFNVRKKLAEQQLEMVKQHGEKLTKKRNTFIGALQVAHGSGLSGIDNEILRARTSLTEVTNDLHERTTRWHAIETLIGRSITRNSGVKELKRYISNYENIIKSVNSGAGIGSLTASTTNSGSNHVNSDAYVSSPPFSSTQTSSIVSRSASQPNFARYAAVHNKKQSTSIMDNTQVDDVSSILGSDSTAVNTIEPRNIGHSSNEDMFAPLSFAQRQPIMSNINDGGATVKNKISNEISTPVEARSSTLTNGVVARYNKGHIPMSRSAVSFDPALRDSGALTNTSWSGSSGKSVSDAYFNGIHSADNSTHSLESVSATSADDVNSSVSTHRTPLPSVPPPISQQPSSSKSSSKFKKNKGEKGSGKCSTIPKSETFDVSTSSEKKKKSLFKKFVSRNSSSVMTSSPSPSKTNSNEQSVKQQDPIEDNNSRSSKTHSAKSKSADAL